MGEGRLLADLIPRPDLCPTLTFLICQAELIDGSRFEQQAQFAFVQFECCTLDYSH